MAAENTTAAVNIEAAVPLVAFDHTQQQEHQQRRSTPAIQHDPPTAIFLLRQRYEKRSLVTIRKKSWSSRTGGNYVAKKNGIVIGCGGGGGAEVSNGFADGRRRLVIKTVARSNGKQTVYDGDYRFSETEVDQCSVNGNGVEITGKQKFDCSR